MARGASFHLKPVRSPAAAGAHNSRAWTDEHPAPAYLLPDEHSLGHWHELTVEDPETVHAQKMAMASGKARAMAMQGGYSPLWEGVLNLPYPVGDDRDRAHLGAMVRAFVDGYQRITGHRVIAADVHLDEGRIEADGATILNPHAHVVVDRTDARGRPIRLTKEQLRKVQDLAAATTGLDRGEDAAVTRRRHLPHQVYRGLAKAGRVQSREDAEEAQELAEEARTTAELYGELRGLLKATGVATQAAYQMAKAKREDRAWIVRQIAALEQALQVQRDQAQAATEAAKADRLAREAAEREALQARQEAASASSRPPVVREVVRTGVQLGGKDATPAELIERITRDGQTIERLTAERPTFGELATYVALAKSRNYAPFREGSADPVTRSELRVMKQALEALSPQTRGRGSGRG